MALLCAASVLTCDKSFVAEALGASQNGVDVKLCVLRQLGIVSDNGDDLKGENSVGCNFSEEEVREIHFARKDMACDENDGTTHNQIEEYEDDEPPRLET